MRLWHEGLIEALPRQQLLGQHRECCALRGNGWGRKHETVNYVFDYSPYKLFQYHQLIMDDMKRRGYNVSVEWLDVNYRGKQCAAYSELEAVPLTAPIYPEHDGAYLKECVENLAGKGIFI
ncbi:TIGR02328 family protein [Fundicoccus sp. Sow4_D5]|uniref:TIGR02328 family protein n=1 Tax=Fundicoccus sp. Sow4_D5 TaxID=3438782 RepID=UPI003F9290AE